MSEQTFRVYVKKDYLKFNAAHFIAYKGFREALHGHNYRVSVEVEGVLGQQGYVLDFGVVKKVAKRVCMRLDERTIVPALSDCLTIRTEGRQVVLNYEDDEFRIPLSDAILLPIVHSSAEELARYLVGEVRAELAAEGAQGITVMEVGVEETPGQTAFCRAVP
ncbi:6-carboxytetrahydropterin synthase [Candidatus Binatia bacterium]|nr:6-carboxytetrahydropterin synthase [Candidatus Binatia bacterium]